MRGGHCRVLGMEKQAEANMENGAETGRIRR